VFPLGRYDRQRWKAGWEDLFRGHELVHNVRRTVRIAVSDEGDGAFLLIVSHRAAPRGTLVLRPASGEPATLQLGAINTRHAVLVPLPGRAHLDRLAAGAVEFELSDDGGTWWTTLVAERVDGRPALQTRGVE
jgi:hypothetical protein